MKPSEEALEFCTLQRHSPPKPGPLVLPRGPQTMTTSNPRHVIFLPLTIVYKPEYWRDVEVSLEKGRRSIIQQRTETKDELGSANEDTIWAFRGNLAGEPRIAVSGAIGRHHHSWPSSHLPCLARWSRCSGLIVRAQLRGHIATTHTHTERERGREAERADQHPRSSSPPPTRSPSSTSSPFCRATCSSARRGLTGG